MANLSSRGQRTAECPVAQYAQRGTVSGSEYVLKAQFTLLLLALMLGGCGGNDVRGNETSAGEGYNPDSRALGKTLVYECLDYEFIARLGPGEMAVWLDDRYVILSQVRSASGVKYAEGDTLFWMKGDEAMLTLDGQRYSGCQAVPARAPWEDARRRGVDFRAVGNEPGWHLELQFNRQLLFVGDYGMLRVMVSDPGEQLEGSTRVYHVVEGANDLRLEIVDDPCVDSMNGDDFPSQVSVQLNGRSFWGCGRMLDHPWQ